MRLLCKKTLTHNDKSESFTKGRVYKTWYSTLCPETVVVNNQGQEHELGEKWCKFFKVTP